MIYELIVTSAPRGLQAGRSGFTTVARTRGIHPDLATRLEAASGYRHVFSQGDPRNPVILSYTIKPSAVGEVRVLSRVGDAGTDYTGRSNKIAHHIALQSADIPPLAGSSPATVLAALVASNRLRSQWAGEPSETPTPPALPAPAVQPGLCQHWASVAGDAGFAGVLVERALKKESTWVIAPPGADMLRLFSEALALVAPGQRWQIPFTTYALRGDEGLWLGTTAGSPEAEAATAQQRIATIDLTRHLSVPADSPYVSAARGRGAVPWLRSSTPPVAEGPEKHAVTTSTSAARSADPRLAGAPSPGRPPTWADGLARPTPPGLDELEEIPLPRPNKTRLLLLGAIAAAALLLSAPLLSYGAYRLRILPERWSDAIEVTAWRRNLSLFDHKLPTEIAEARALLKDLKGNLDTLRTNVGERDYSAHPTLAKSLNKATTLFDELSKLVENDDLARSVATEDVAKCLANHENARDAVALLSHDLALLNAHLEAASTLKSLPSEATTEKDESRQELLALLDPITAENRKQVVALTQALRLKPDQPGDSASPVEGGNSAAEGKVARPTKKPSLWSILSKEVQKQGNRPKEGINTSENSTLVSWPKEAAPESLKEVELSLPSVVAPDEFLCDLSRGTTTADSMEWACYLKHAPDDKLGIFKLTTSGLVFSPEKDGDAFRRSILPFLPLILQNTGTESGDDNARLWIQLCSPHSVPAGTRIQEGSALSVFDIETTALPAMKFVQQHLQWRALSVAAASPPGSPTVLLARKPTDAFKESICFEAATIADEPVTFLWRPTALAKSAAFFDQAELTFAVGEQGAKVAATASLQCTHSGVGQIPEELPTLLKPKLKEFTSADPPPSFSADDWAFLCRRAFLPACTFGDPSWKKQNPKQQEAQLTAARRNVAAAIGIDIKKDFDNKRVALRFSDWLAHFRTLVTRGHRYQGHIESLVQTETGEPTPVEPGEKPSSGDKPSDSEDQKKLKEWEAKEAAWRKWVQAKEELENDDRVLSMWAALEVAQEGKPTDDMLLAALWLSAYRFDAVQRHLQGDSAKVPTSLDVEISGQLGVCWNEQLLPAPDELPEEARFIVIAKVHSSRSSEHSPPPGPAASK